MWHLAVHQGISVLLGLFALVLGVVALIHCATQRADAFTAIGTLQKPAWLAVLAVSTVLGVLFGGFGASSFGMLFTLIAIGAAAFYLLDVRPGLRDIAEGHGPW